MRRKIKNNKENRTKEEEEKKEQAKIARMEEQKRVKEENALKKQQWLAEREEEARALQEARDAGADFSLLVSPYYNKPNQEGLIKHYLQIADSVDIPQILYNVPSRTGCDILPETVKVLADHENIIGIKEALDDMKRIQDLLDISNALNDKKDLQKPISNTKIFEKFSNSR